MENMLQKYCLIMFTQDGEVITLPREASEVNHHQAYQRLAQLVPGLFDGFEENPQKSGGYELSSYIAANGDAVLFPSNINNSELMVLALPKPMENKIGEKVLEFLELVGEIRLYVYSAHFKNLRSKKVIHEFLSNCGDYNYAMTKVREYYEVSKKMNDLGNISEEDIRMSRR